MATWLKGQRYQGDRSFMTNTTYFDNEKIRIQRVLARSKITMITDTEDADHIFGYVVFKLVSDLFIIHYAHLKKPYRKLGIMKGVVSKIYEQFGKDETAITHINESVASLRSKYKLKYNPYLEDYF